MIYDLRIKSKKVFLLLFIFLCLFVFFLREIDLTTTDLGRHIKNGETILQGDTLEKVLYTNFYSYTSTDFPFVNHHWGSGVIFFLIKSLFGFGGLSVFFAGITALTLLVFFSLARGRSKLLISLLVLVWIIPVLYLRTEIRPEIFSYFFCGLFWLILDRKKWLYFLPFLMLFWVNLHSYFFVGFILIGLYWFEQLISVLLKKGNRKYFGKISLFLVLSILAGLINPSGVRGLLYPLHIFDNFGYRLLENQSTFFLERVIGEYPAGIYFRILFLILVFSFVWKLAKEKKIEPVNFLLAIFVSVFAFKAVRNFAVFGFFCLPIIAQNLKSFRLHKDETINKFIFILLGTVLVPTIFFIKPQYWLQRNKIGFGLETGEKEAAEYFLDNKLKGPIFNNYDIGSYLIYYLFPSEKVFVDNRPEAYPTSFFKEEYMPMQEQEDKWKETEQKYNFNAIFFYRLDLTPWAQTFLISLVENKNWAPVYVDGKRIIFLKRVKQNEEIIKKFELPKEMFSVKK